MAMKLKESLMAKTMTKNENIYQTLFVNRNPESIKSDYGRNLIFGGSTSFPNAPIIAASFSSVSGVGYTGIAVPEETYIVAASRAPLTCVFENFKTIDECFMVKGNDDLLNHCLKTYSSILFGNGIKNDKRNYEFLCYLIRNYEGNLVIDATGLTLLSEYGCQILKEKKDKENIILTPHLGEANKIFGTSIESRNPQDYQEAALSFTKEFSVSILLKSYHSAICSREKFRILDTPKTPCLGKAGSGDGLAGLLSGLLSYGTKSFEISEIISFSDFLIHTAAKKCEETQSKGTADILTVLSYLKTH